MPAPVWLPSVVPIPGEPVSTPQSPSAIAALTTIDEGRLRDLLPELEEEERLYRAWWIDAGQIGVETSQRRWLAIDRATGIQHPLPRQNARAHLRQAAQHLAGAPAAFRWERGRFVELVQEDVVLRRWDYLEETDDRRAELWIILDGACLALGEQRFWLSWQEDDRVELCTGFRAGDLALYDRRREEEGYRYLARRLDSGAVIDVQPEARDHLLLLQGLSSDERFLLNAADSADWGIVDRVDWSISRPAVMGARVSVVHHPEALSDPGGGWLVQPRETDADIVDIWATPRGHLLPAVRITAQDRPEGWPFLRSLAVSPDGRRLLVCGSRCLAVAELPTEIEALHGPEWRSYAAAPVSVRRLAMHPSAMVIDYLRDVIDLRSGCSIATDARLPSRQRRYLPGVHPPSLTGWPTTGCWLGIGLLAKNCGRLN